KEATVYRQLQNVLISAHGFSFPSGQSEIQADNFPLMNKIVDAIKTFPNARIEVGGHTDSSGSDAANQKLSEARAAKVAKFLKEVGGIAADRVSSRGFGEAKPVASNETGEGRAENRRVEIKIVN
ncbi:MAG: OmpA family protein, partial [Pseudomonadota bacterium]|nr:OmpA family protein [Pseudomonadota bacterium]